MPDLVLGQHISVHLKGDEAPYRVIGKFRGTSYTSGETDWSYVVEGEVGDQIGKLVYIPSENVKLIETSKIS